MRPVIRGESPKDDNGETIAFKTYQQARGELIKRIGEVCSYCEMHLDASLAVEHMLPKQPPGHTAPIADRELAWDNMLLACTNCNSTKSNKEIHLTDYIWPDRDNTFLALTYKEGGIVEATPGTNSIRAGRIIKLVGLNVIPTSGEQAREASDRRWNNRREAWEIATRSRERLAILNNDPTMQEQIVDGISGYWSIWMTVFKDNQEMLGRIIKKLPGTDTNYFDSANGFTPVEHT